VNGIANEKSSSSGETEQADVPAEMDNDNWATANAEFVASDNEIIDADGVALEEYRLF
jgi:post-segregation antitoxin (ccd killing protein)